MKPKRPGNWTEADHEIIRECIRAGMPNREIQEKHFPHRTTESVKRRVGDIRAEMGLSIHTNFSRSKHAPGPTKPLLLKPLEYTLECCPRVTFAEACEWMRGQKKHWTPTGDRKADWQMINAARLYGRVPVPPMLPRNGM